MTRNANRPATVRAKPGGDKGAGGANVYPDYTAKQSQAQLWARFERRVCSLARQPYTADTLTTLADALGDLVRDAADAGDITILAAVANTPPSSNPLGCRQRVEFTTDRVEWARQFGEFRPWSKLEVVRLTPASRARDAIFELTGVLM